MILGINGIIAGRGADADVLAFITAANITDTTQKNAVNQLVTDLKSANIWTKMKAIYPFVGGTAAQHRFNLKDPRPVASAFYLDFYGGGTHSANGYKPDGATAYANTYLSPSLHLTSGQNHLSFYARTSQSTNAVPIGVFSDSTRYNQMNISTGVGFVYYDGGLDTEMLSSISSSTGFFIGTTRASNDRKGFQNGVSIISKTTNLSTVYCTIPVYIGARNAFFGTDSYTTQESAFASIGDGLTDAEAANFYTAVQTFQTTLNRQVI